jgi:hypothetical protein
MRFFILNFSYGKFEQIYYAARNQIIIKDA